MVVLSYFSAGRLPGVCDAIARRMKAEGIPFEIVIMDDGSTDDTQSVADDLERARPEVRSFALSKNYTTNYSKFAGLQVCRGDCAVFVPDDFQRSLDTVVEMYRLWQSGEKIVVDYRATRSDGVVSDLLSDAYYRIMNSFSDVTFPPGGTDGALLDREIIDLVNARIRPTNTSLMVEVLRLGFNPHFLPARRHKGDGKSRWTFGKKVRLATDTFFNSSSLPITLITWVGLATFLGSMVLIVLVGAVRLFWAGRFLGFSIRWMDDYPHSHSAVQRPESAERRRSGAVSVENLPGSQGQARVHHQEEGRGYAREG